MAMTTRHDFTMPEKRNAVTKLNKKDCCKITQDNDFEVLSKGVSQGIQKVIFPVWNVFGNTTFFFQNRGVNATNAANVPAKRPLTPLYRQVPPLTPLYRQVPPLTPFCRQRPPLTPYAFQLSAVYAVIPEKNASTKNVNFLYQEIKGIKNSCFFKILFDKRLRSFQGNTPSKMWRNQRGFESGPEL